MEKTHEILQLPATEMRNLFERMELSPVEVVNACLSRIESCNQEINAICTLSENALEDAKKAEQAFVRGDNLGLLHGIPIGIKDVTPTCGLRTTFGCTCYADHVPDEDAIVVNRLKKAGAIVLGKTNTPEFATGGNTFNELFGYTRNPWNSKLSAGGSTGGGAAALATGMIALAEGTDLGGSLRIPASFCGVVGLRPSPGLVPTWPAGSLWDSLYVTGPMARTVEDVALMLQAIYGPSDATLMSLQWGKRDFPAATHMPVAGVRIAYCRDIAMAGIEDEIELICRKAALGMTQAGAIVEEIEMDLSFANEAFLTLRGMWMVNEHFERLDRLDNFGDNLANNIRAGLNLSPRKIAASENLRKRLWRKLCELFQNFDYLLTPCISISPFPVEENYPKMIAGQKMKTYIDWVAPTFLLSLAALPVASVPCGLTSRRLPVGLQIAGRPNSEESVLALASHLQKAHPIGLPKVQ